MSQDRALLRLSFLVQYVHCYTCVFCCRNTELEKQKVNNLVYFAPPCIHTMNRRNLAIINASLTRNRRITTKRTPVVTKAIHARQIYILTSLATDDRIVSVYYEQIEFIITPLKQVGTLPGTVFTDNYKQISQNEAISC